MRQRARLLFDSARMDALVDARAAVGGERSLLFAVGALSVDMVAYPAEGGLQIVHGQVIDVDLECPVREAHVRLGECGDIVETDRHGQFALSTLLPLDGQVLRIDTGTLDLDCPVPAEAHQSGSPA